MAGAAFAQRRARRSSRMMSRLRPTRRASASSELLESCDSRSLAVVRAAKLTTLGSSSRPSKKLFFIAESDVLDLDPDQIVATASLEFVIPLLHSSRE
jgi:hypothetical protein